MGSAGLASGGLDWSSRLFSLRVDPRREPGSAGDVGVRGGWVSAVGGERLQALERAVDRCGPGPVGGEVQRGAAGVAGELSGDVQDAVAQPLGFAILCSPSSASCCVQTMMSCASSASSNHAAFALKEWNGRCAGAGRLQRLDAVLDLGVLAVKGLQGGDVRVLLVGDEALETVPVIVSEGELRPGVGTLAAADQPGAGRPGGRG